ncbi:MAG: peptidoglycan-binding domain-containing protein [Actinomycetota bacterium]
MRRQVTIVVGLLVLVGAAAVGWVAALQIKSPAQVAAEAEPPEPSAITVPVEEMVISNDVVTRGSVRFERPESISVSSVALDGVAPVVTQAPAIGDEFSEGDVLLEVAGRPVFVLEGDLPLFRTARRGDTGEDIAQLQEALVRLGFEIDEIDGVFGRQTEDAVVAFYESRGYEPLKVRNRRPPGGYPAPETEFMFFATFPIRVDSVLIERGDVAAGEVMQVSGARLAIDSSVKLAEAEYVEVGTPVLIELDRLGVSMTGVVSEVAGGPGTNNVAVDKVYVEILPDEVRADLNNTNVKVTIPVASRSTSGAVLAVPAAALSATGSGDTIVTVENADGTTRAVAVTPGLSTAGGMVEITPVDGDLKIGDRVVVGFQTTS